MQDTRLSGSPTMPQSQDPFYAGLGQAVRIGTELLAALIVGGGLGWAVDTYLETGRYLSLGDRSLGSRSRLDLGCGGRREECLSNGATVAPVTD
jgi:hypothetical protein